MHEYAGNLHVHTTYSDGASSVEDICAAAGKAGLDFVMFSDHNTLAPLRDGKEGRHGSVLALIGMEVGEDHNHYLAWRISREVQDDPENPQSVIDRVRAQGGLGFIAHPFEVGCRYGFSGMAFTWDDWDVSGFTGICIWNFTSQWKGPLTDPARALLYYLFPRLAVRAPDRTTLAKWDERLQSGRVVGIGGTDAHEFRYGTGPLKVRIFPYSFLFKTINTHVLTDAPLTGDTARDSELIYSALERGSCYISYGPAGDTRGFRFTALSDKGDTGMGGETGISPGMRLTLSMPRASHARVIKDGDLWREGYGRELEFPVTGPGVYRAEACRRGVLGGRYGWLYSNPIYVRP